MTQKTISLPEEIYEKLKKKKHRNESFPDLIERLISEDEQREQKHQIMDLAGALGDNSEEWEKISQSLYNDRLNSKKRNNIDLENLNE